MLKLVILLHLISDDSSSVSTSTSVSTSVSDSNSTSTSDSNSDSSSLSASDSASTSASLSTSASELSGGPVNNAGGTYTGVSTGKQLPATGEASTSTKELSILGILTVLSALVLKKKKRN